MITPAYSPTATERVLPRMALDFTTGVLDARVTVTRALDTATRVNSGGSIEIVNANLPRFDYDPVTLLPKGLLIEESRANLLVRSAEFNVSPWFVDGVSVDPNSTTSPDGTSTADAIIENLATSNHNVNTTATVTVAPHTYSAYVKPNGRSWVRLFVFQSGITANSTWFNVSTGAAGFANAGASNVSIRPAGNGWYRCSITFTPASAASASFYIAVADADGSGVYAGNGTSGLFIWGAQAELGAFATSYIPTTSTSLTRNADVVSMTGTNFSDWYTSSSAALAAVVIPSIATGTRPIWQLDDTTANEIIALRGNVANPELYIVDGGTPQAQLDAGTITANTQYGLCAAFAANSCAASQNGAAPVTTATATMPTVTQARIGSDGSNFLNGAVRTLRYWPQRILNAETQAFSKV